MRVCGLTRKCFSGESIFVTQHVSHHIEFEFKVLNPNLMAPRPSSLILR
jgi:hypothetical protein